MVTRRPRAFNRLPRLDAVSPLPSEEATPPVTNTCLVCCGAAKWGLPWSRARCVLDRRKAGTRRIETGRSFVVHGLSA